MHIFGKLVHIFGELVHIFGRKLVSRTSKQVSRNRGPLWQPGVYNDTKKSDSKVTLRDEKALWGSLWGRPRKSVLNQF